MVTIKEIIGEKNIVIYFYPKDNTWGCTKQACTFRDSFQDFIDVYIEEDRTVSEQVLNLTFSEKQAIVDFLEENYKGQNKYYKYDFFFDNCTSRVRDLLSKVLSDKLVWNQKANENNLTFRKSLDPYIITMPWVKFGFYLGLGNVTDRIPNYFEAMFLPSRLEKGLALANIQGRTVNKPLVSKTISIYNSLNKEASVEPFVTPELVFGLILILALILSYFQFKNQIQPYWFDLWLWTNTGLAGILVLFLWFGTDHKATANNMNFIWSNPLWLFALGTIVSSKINKYKIVIQYLMFIICFNLVLFSPFFPQSFHHSFILIMLILAIRSAMNIWSIKKFNIN